MHTQYRSDRGIDLMKKIFWIAGLLLLAGLPLVSADEIGTPPSQDCEYVANTVDSNQPVHAYGGVDPDGNLAILFQYGNPAFFVVTKIDQDCNEIWSIASAGSSGNPDDFGCEGRNPITGKYCWPMSGLGVDARGDVVFHYQTGGGGQRYLAKLDGLTGEIETISPEYSTIPGWGSSLDIARKGVCAVRLSDTETGYIVTLEGAGKIALFAEDLQTTTWIINPGGSPDTVRCDQNGSNVYAEYGGAYRRLDVTDGSLEASSGGVGVANVGAGAGDAAAYYLSGTTEIDWNSIDLSTFAAISSAQSPTPDQFQVGAVDKNTAIGSWDVDAGDSILTCGVVTDGAESYQFAAKVDTGGNIIEWGTLYEANGAALAPENAPPCLLDFNAGFWASGEDRCSGNECYRFAHYTGGGFAQHTFLPIDDEPAGASGPGGPILAPFIDYCTAQWGFECSNFWGLGIFGLVIWGVRRAQPIVVGSIALILEYVLYKIDLFPFWILLATVFLIIAVAGHKLWGSGTGPGEEGDTDEAD